MIKTVIWISVSRLLRNRVELALTFVVPVVFFSIFAVIFGNGITGGTSKIKAVVIDSVGSSQSALIQNQLESNDTLRIMQIAAGNPLNAKDAIGLVQRGRVTVAVLLKVDDSNRGATSIAADVLVDASDEVASQMAVAIVNQAMIQASASHPNVLLASHAQASSPIENANEVHPHPIVSTANLNTAASPPSLVKVVDVLGDSKSNPVVSMYAAGIAVMFLLFNATGGGGALLEERETSTLERLLTTQMSMDQLLLGKWCFQTMLGVLQVTMMFVWGALVFDIDLWSKLEGFVAMTLVTAAAASSFGLFLATLCKSRGQLNGLSVILILTMSALGGSMVPRYLMSESLLRVGQFTFNAWALDGYNKIFWRDLSLADIHVELAVLASVSAMMLITARAIAVRWETT